MEKKNPFLQLYLHVTGIAGALSLVNLSDDVIAFRRIIQNIGEAWADLVAPFAHFLFGWFVYRVLVNADYREPAEQYLLLGLIFGLGIVRFYFLLENARVRLPARFGGDGDDSINLARAALFLFPLTAFFYFMAWPFWILALTVGLIFAPAEERLNFLFAIYAPVIYFGLILIINQALFVAS